MKASTTYNKSEIMKAAWKSYRVIFKRQGKSFGYALKQAWEIARMEVEAARKAEARKIEAAKSMAEFNEAKKAWKADTTDFTSFYEAEQRTGLTWTR